MLIIIFCFAAGIGLGYCFRTQKKLHEIANRLTQVALYVMLFTMGASIGANEAIFKNINTLGIQGLVLSLGAVTGSILTVYPVYVFLLGERE